MNSILILAALLLGAGVGYLLAHLRAAVRLERARNDQVRIQARLDALSDARESLANEFRVLSAAILDAHSQKFADQNRTALHALLSPLGNDISAFKRKLEELHLDDAKERSALQRQVELLSRQSHDVGQKADRLADALQGDNKQLGNWGELALERLLEAAGLRKGQDYELQRSVPSADGGRAQPDAVVRLPDDRCVLVDAKASLKHYVEFSAARDPAARAAALKAHLQSIEAHVKGLSERRYPELDAFKDRAPDFVLMFVPIEPALAIALDERPELHEFAVRRNVVLVGPGSLLVALRLVGQLWRQENQRSAMRDVFEAVRKIYEKYVGFAEDMQQIDDALQKAQAAYADARKKLSTGDGNLVRQMHRFVETNLIKPKRLPPPAYRPNPDDEPAP
jgi:DNA recombination protein RmuC